MNKLSIIIPVYCNEGSIKEVYKDVINNIVPCIENYEIIFVDDGSYDASWSVLENLKKSDNSIMIIKLSRNFGSYAAIMAGFSKASGDCAVVKAADLQEPATLIVDMYNKWKSGSKVVIGVRKGRNDGVLNNLCADLYYKIIRKFVMSNMPNRGFDISLIDKSVKDIILSMNQKNSKISLQVLWTGYQTTKVYYERLERKVGKSKWTLAKKIKLVIDTLIGYSYIPIRFMSLMGVIFLCISIVWAMKICISKLMGNIPILGYSSLMIVLLFSAGMIMFTLGVLGEYIWRTLDETRNMPLFIIDEEK